MNRRRLLQTALLVVGLAGVGLAVARTMDQAKGHVLPSAGALAIAATLALVAILASAQAWIALFTDLVTTRSARTALRNTFLLSQLTKYLPVGGVVQAASQVGLARAIGIPWRRTAVAFPVSVVGAVVGGATFGSGVVFASGVAAWIRVVAALGLTSLVMLHRGLMAWVLDRARRFVRRIPESDQLPSQRAIIVFYLWALVTIGSLSAAYAVLVRSLVHGVNPARVFCAFALSWVIGFLVVPIPAGIGVREAVLVALLPGVGAAPLLAASLALRLLTIGTEVAAFFGNKVATRRTPGVPPVDLAAAAPASPVADPTGS
jgi:uncharacterized membrane protein YbhN (UPF0104 family)